MHVSRFTQPVSIFVGLGFAREIETVGQAFEMLNEWTGARGPAYATALGVCRKALEDGGDIETARFAFETFASSRGILAPDALVLAARQAADEWLTG